MSQDTQETVEVHSEEEALVDEYVRCYLKTKDAAAPYFMYQGKKRKLTDELRKCDMKSRDVTVDGKSYKLMRMEELLMPDKGDMMYSLRDIGYSEDEALKIVKAVQKKRRISVKYEVID
jgi:hypothetical protein